MNEQDKYRLKAQRIVGTLRSHKDNYYDNPLDGWQQNEFCDWVTSQLADALAGSAREAMKRAVEIVEEEAVNSTTESDRAKCEDVAEAIRKGAKNAT